MILYGSFREETPKGNEGAGLVVVCSIVFPVAGRSTKLLRLNVLGKFKGKQGEQCG